MKEREGVIKFSLDFTEAPAVLPEEIAELNAWRQILFRLGLVGRDPARYGGLGYGNVSLRLPPWDSPGDRRPFLVSGTQTGGLPDLGPGHYTTVLSCHPGENRIVASGPIRPSSEALTHGALYALDPSLRVVLHVHSPAIWRRAAELGIPLTSAEAAYGTPEMAAEVRRLFVDPAVRSGRLLAMGGHEDGLVAFGATAEEAGLPLVAALARALHRAG